MEIYMYFFKTLYQSLKSSIVIALVWEESTSRAHSVRMSVGGRVLDPDERNGTDHLGLFDSAREAVEQEALAAGWRVQVLLDEFHHHLVADLQTNTQSAS